MTTPENIEKRLMDALLSDHAVAVTLQGLKGYKGGYSTLLPEVPRPGDILTFAVERKRGQGRYVVKEVEWAVRGTGEVIVHVTPVM
jgi:hypothetical protein